MQLVGPVYLVGGQDFNMVYLDWPANDSNTYVINTGDPLLLIDCGCGESWPAILNNINQAGCDTRDITHLFLTHAHMPHAGAAETIRRNGVEVLASAAAAEAVQTGGLPTVAYEYHRRFLRVQQVTQMQDGEEMTLGACQVRAIHLPGHSPGSMGYEVIHDGRRMLFCGDAVRSPLLEQHRGRLGYDAEEYAKTLVRLLEDPPDVLYPGHGPFCVSKTEHWIGEELRKLLEDPA